jgi:hypothetical protein
MSDDDNVSNELNERLSENRFLEGAIERRIPGLEGWQRWLHAIIAAMDEQRQRDGLGFSVEKGGVLSGELFALLAELDDCQKVYRAYVMDDQDGESHE